MDIDQLRVEIYCQQCRLSVKDLLGQDNISEFFITLSGIMKGFQVFCPCCNSVVHLVLRIKVDN